MQSITLISPHLMVSKQDIFTTGIVYMPVGLAYFAGMLKQKKIPYQVVDCFAESPNSWKISGNFLINS